MVRVRGVDAYQWNPTRIMLHSADGRLLPRVAKVSNFGDMLGPVIVGQLAPRRGPRRSARRLLTVGSVMHFARDGDVVWGTGVNGKVPLSDIRAARLDIRAVRGPLTSRALAARGHLVPQVFGDPGLLAPDLFNVVRHGRPPIPVTSLPNLHDAREWLNHPGFLHPQTPWNRVLNVIAASERVITSSLHGVVICDALKVPVSLVRPSQESLFKYEDYYEGTGRALPRLSDSYSAVGDRITDALQWNADPLLDAFPRDLWDAAAPRGMTSAEAQGDKTPW